MISMSLQAASPIARKGMNESPPDRAINEGSPAEYPHFLLLPPPGLMFDPIFPISHPIHIPDGSLPYPGNNTHFHRLNTPPAPSQAVDPIWRVRLASTSIDLHQLPSSPRDYAPGCCCCCCTTDSFIIMTAGCLLHYFIINFNLLRT